MFPVYLTDLPPHPKYHHEIVIKKAAVVEHYNPVSSPKLREIRARYNNQPFIPNMLVARQA